jgi:hypothetical protein
MANYGSAVITSISLKCLQSCQFRQSCRSRQCRQYASEVAVELGASLLTITGSGRSARSVAATS